MSLDSEKFDDLVKKTIEKVKEHPSELLKDAKVIGHGHIGDGNLHLNCSMKGFTDKKLVSEVENIIQPFVF